MSPLLAAGRPFPGPFTQWAKWLAIGLDEQTQTALRKATYTGRPFGSDQFIDRLEDQAGRPLSPQRHGRKSNSGSWSNPELQTNLGPETRSYRLLSLRF